MSQAADEHHSTQGPRFLAALDHVQVLENGSYLARCPHFGCNEPLTITPAFEEWRFDCEAGCTNQEIVDYLQCDTRLDPVKATRAWRALMLAQTPEQWQALLEGQSVPTAELDPYWVKRFGLK